MRARSRGSILQGLILSAVILVPSGCKREQSGKVGGEPANEQQQLAQSVDASQKSQMEGFDLKVAYAGLVALVPEEDKTQGTTLTALLVARPDHNPRLRIPKIYIEGIDDEDCPSASMCPVPYDNGDECVWTLSGVKIELAGRIRGDAFSEGPQGRNGKFLPVSQTDGAHPSWIVQMKNVHGQYSRSDEKHALLENGEIAAYSSLPYNSYSTCYLTEYDKKIYSYRFFDKSGGGPDFRQALAEVVESKVEVESGSISLFLRTDLGCRLVIPLAPDAGRIEFSVSNLPEPRDARMKVTEHFDSYYDLSSTSTGAAIRRSPKRFKNGGSIDMQPDCRNKYADPCEYLELDFGFPASCNRTACPVLIMDAF